MKPITILWSDGVSEAEAKECIGAMRDILRFLQKVAVEQDIGLAPIMLRPYGNWALQNSTANEAYHSFRWYWESSLDQRSGQVSAATLIDIVRYEPWQHADPHLDLVLLHTELHDDTENQDGDFPSVFACTEPDLVTIISLRHLSQIADANLRLKCLRNLVMHNFGHLVGLPNGLPSGSRAQTGESASAKRASAHPCVAPCIMVETQSIDELMTVAAAAEEAGIYLCKTCHEVTRSLVFSLHFSTN